jgi:AbrB family looped-hinge helix DNA binding protein
MTVTIDGAGRLVVPKSLREHFNLVAGTELEIEASAECLRLRKVGAGPALVRKKGILVHHGAARVTFDAAAFLRAERESRSRRLFPEGSG